MHTRTRDLLAVALLGLALSATVVPSADAAPLAPRTVPKDSFTIAVQPDTQEETVHEGDRRLVNRNQWILDQREALDIRFVGHTGDLTNWGWLAPEQLQRASDAFTLFEDAGLPYAITPGNHDSRGVGWDHNGGYGGAAYVENPECLQRFDTATCRMSVLLRHTEEINAVFDVERFGNVRGAFEDGKIDNVWSTFNAQGYRWMVLDLEPWPRGAVVDWANDVVSAHPDVNVLVSTHGYLRARGTISPMHFNGETSGRDLWNELVSQHSNIWGVVCGHEGKARTRTNEGVHGNKVVTMLTAMHSDTTNPLRLATIDPRDGTLTTKVVAPYTHQTFGKTRRTIGGLDFVK